MFLRVKESGKYQYLRLVENRKEKGRVKQRLIATLGRMDELSAKGRVETLSQLESPPLNLPGLPSSEI